jgi:hypothetical protein
MDTIPDLSSLPPFLRDSPEELDQLPLQLSLLTMEVAAHRMRLQAMASLTRTLADTMPEPQRVQLMALADTMEPPAIPAELITGEGSNHAGTNGDDDSRRD